MVIRRNLPHACTACAVCLPAALAIGSAPFVFALAGVGIITGVLGVVFNPHPPTHR